MKKIIIKGMSCGHCQTAVTNALNELGLNNVVVDLDKGTATFDETNVSGQTVTDAIDDAGFEVISFE